MRKMYRNKNCGELTIKNVGEEVTLAGWIQRIRNLGAMKFIDLRDQFGITQIVISDNEEIQKQAEDLVKLAKEKGTPILEKAASDVKQKTIEVLNNTIARLESSEKTSKKKSK